MNSSGTRFLDAIGDVCLPGHTVLAEFSAGKSAHKLDNRLLCALRDDESASEKVTFKDSARVSISCMIPVCA